MKLLAEHKVVLEANIQKFEDYILKMKSRCEKKKEVCEQLVEELKQKGNRNYKAIFVTIYISIVTVIFICKWKLFVINQFNFSPPPFFQRIFNFGF